jgi:ABC-type sugar transport system permease subunit
VARIIFFMPIILASGVIGLVDGQAMSYATGNGQVIDEGIALNMSNFLDITEFLNSLNFPKFLIDVVNSSISNIYTIAKASGLQIFVFLAGLQEISPSFYEAASIEGCSKWELFWKITFPIITPQTIANTVYTIAAFGMDYNIFFSYTNTLAFNQNNYSAATAMNLIYLSALALIVAAIFLILKKISPKLDG